MPGTHDSPPAAPPARAREQPAGGVDLHRRHHGPRGRPTAGDDRVHAPVSPRAGVTVWGFRRKRILGIDPSQPTDLDLDLREQVLKITWADGVVSRLPLPMLRKECPCATCRTEREERGRSLLPILKAAPAETIEATGGHLVGNYALQLEWSDGHNTGIYDFRLLRTLADAQPP
ncbi:MAG: DUF971 domain-containing protein [Planctomycetes bacterium]|nr:DUF971 domain-containing protein [Planctomycetota bacterium]